MVADDCERFLNELEEYLEAYKQHPSSTLSRQTVTKHSIVIHHWCQFISQYKSLTNFSGLTVAMVRSGFFSYFKSYNDDELTPITFLPIEAEAIHLCAVYRKHSILRLSRCGVNLIKFSEVFQ